MVAPHMRNRQTCCGQTTRVCRETLFAWWHHTCVTDKHVTRVCRETLFAWWHHTCVTDKHVTRVWALSTFRVHYIVPLDMDNGTFNISHTDVVEKVNLLVPASQHGGTSIDGGRIPIARGQKWLCFGHFSRGDPSLWIFSKTKF